MSTLIERIVIAIEALAVFVCLVHHVWKFVTRQSRSRWTHLCLKRMCGAAWSKAASFVRHILQGDTGVIGKAIAEQMKDFRLGQFDQLVTQVGPWVGFMWLALLIYGYTLADTKVCEEGWNALFFIYLGCFYMFTHLVATGCVKTHIWMLDIFYLVNMCALILQAAEVDEFRWYSSDASSRVFMQIVCGLLYMDYTKSIPCNIAFMIVHCWHYPSSARVNYSNECERRAMIKFVAIEVGMCVGVSASCYIVQKWLQARIRMQIIAQNQQCATQKLAAYSCDALCWLAPDLHLSRPAPQLASMLFMEGAHNGLAGRAFEDFIATDSDKDRFQGLIAKSLGSSQSEGLPMLFHIDLRDTTSRTFPVHVFYSCYVDDNDYIGHLIGISESSARAQVLQEATDMVPAIAPPATDSVVVPTEIGRATDDTKSVASSQSLGSIGTHMLNVEGNMSFVPLIPEHMAPAPVSVALDAMAFEVIGCTTGLTALIGPLVFGTDIRKIVVNSPLFCRWLDHNVNMHLHSDDSELTSFDIKIAPPTSEEQRKFEFHGSAHVIMVEKDVLASAIGADPPTGCEDELYELLCVLEIRDAHVRWISQPRKKSKKAASKARTVVL